MTKREIPKAKDNELIRDAIWTFGWLQQNEILDRGTKQLESHFQDLCSEMVKRGLITQEQWDSFNR